MDYWKLGVCLCVLLNLFTRSYCQRENYLDEAGKIIGTIFHKYNAQVPPWSQYPDPMNFIVNLKPIYISSVDKDSKLMTSTVDLQVTWKDKYLAWYTKVVKELQVSKDRIWHPHITIDNAVGNVVEVNVPDLVMRKEGEVTMRKRIYMSTICDDLDDLKYNCSIKIGTDLYDYNMVRFENSTFDTSMMSLARGYTLENTDSDYGSVVKSSEINTTYPQFTATLTIIDNGVASPAAMTSLLLVSYAFSLFAQKQF